MKKENKEMLMFTLSLLGYAVFYILYVNTPTFSSAFKTIYYFAWLFCLSLCIILYRDKGKETKENKDDMGEDSDFEQRDD